MTSQDLLSQPVSTLRGVGPAVAEKLSAIGVHYNADLLFLLPLRYEDRTRITPIASLVQASAQLVEAEVVESRFMPHRRGALDCLVQDASGQLKLRFFHWGGSLAKRLKPGTRLRAFGEVRFGFHGMAQMAHPKMDLIEPNQPPPPLAQHPEPVYPSTKGVSSSLIQSLITQIIDRLDHPAVAAELELLPESFRQKWQLGELAGALKRIHRPPSTPDTQLPQASVHRLAFEELLAHQLSMRRLRQRARSRKAPALTDNHGLVQGFLDQLGFELTGAQQRVWEELSSEMSLQRPMLRLLQGDVGCGKTVIAALSLLMAASSGRQAALMAPTELLAEQHLRTLGDWLTPLGLKLQWLSGSVRGKARTLALEAIRSDADIIIGTHALMQEGVDYRDLALVVIDEQHRFGVDQRLALRNKGHRGQVLPHQLIMTATPIPRTLAQVAYADLDVSIIDQMPPGRSPVTTVAMSQDRRDHLIERLCTQLRDGRQAYWVCPLIEESELLQSEAAQQTAERLTEALPEFRIGLAHGRMNSRDKDQIMQAFKAGDIQLLVATTVIEVGVDVANASVMVIENPERLGLAQLHQLRGRVGRGNLQGHCVLLYRPPLSESGRQRLQVLRESNDGFHIAEKDMQWRGAGELLGRRQTGEARFRIADPLRDQPLLASMNQAADQLLAADPEAAAGLIHRWLGQATRFADA